jgi:hypothetical protein
MFMIIEIIEESLGLSYQNKSYLQILMNCLYININTNINDVNLIKDD